MNSKKCCVAGCDSCSNREQDRGVKFIKLPKNETFKSVWISQARLSLEIFDKKICYICSRHFRKSDFEACKASKYLLKNEAIPTIFPWGITSLDDVNKIMETYKKTKEMNTTESQETTTPSSIQSNDTLEEPNEPHKSGESVETSLDVQEKNDSQTPQDDKASLASEDSKIQDAEESKLPQPSENSTIQPDKPVSDTKAIEVSTPVTSVDNIPKKKKPGRKKLEKPKESPVISNIESTPDEQFQSFENLLAESVKSTKESTDSVASIIDKQVDYPMLKALIQNPSSSSNSTSSMDDSSMKLKNSSRATDKDGYIVGTKVEVKDFGDQWYPARVMEVDNDDMEVLVHYENWNQKYDEWISMSSPRLRHLDTSTSSSSATPITYVMGERCLARWSDNRRFPATVCNVLPNGKYQVKFDDGFVKIIKWSMISKMRSSESLPSTSATPSAKKIPPVHQGAKKATSGLSAASIVAAQPVAVHNHLFDPKRDHLGSKEERRDMKRKLNVKDLFKKNKRTESHSTEKPQTKVPKEKDPSSSATKHAQKVSDLEQVVPIQKLKLPNANLPTCEIKIEPVKVEPALQTNNIDVSVFLKNEWCCRWLNGQPIGIVNNGVDTEETNGETGLARMSVEVFDHRIPSTWKKFLTRRRVGTSAGKWDVIISDPNGRRFRSRNEMKSRMMESDSAELEPFSAGLLDFSVHRKLARNLGWDTTDSNYKESEINAAQQKAKSIKPPSLPSSPSSKLINSPIPTNDISSSESKKIIITTPTSNLSNTITPSPIITNAAISTPPAILEDGFVYVGSMKVQVIDNLLRCPKEGCFKNFRKDNLLQMHVKHYHREMVKYLGETPNVAALAYARTVMEEAASPKIKQETDKPPQKLKERRQTMHIKTELEIPYIKEENADSGYNYSQNLSSSLRSDGSATNFVDTSPKLRNALITDIKPDSYVKSEFGAIHDYDTQQTSKLLTDSPSKYDNLRKDENQYFGSNRIQSSSKRSKDRPRSHKKQVKTEDKISANSSYKTDQDQVGPVQSSNTLKLTINLNSMTSKHSSKRKYSDNRDYLPKRKKYEQQVDSWEDLDETRSSFGYMDQSSSPYCKTEPGTMEYSSRDYGDESSQSCIINESGEKIKIVHMKREEIINCHCGFGEEDGLMIQCELCLCWQHGLCHNIEKESQVPDKYLCQICLHPYRQRRSQKHLNSQDWIYEGRLHCIVSLPAGELTPGDAPRAQMLKKSHELTGNIMQLYDLIHSLQCKIEVAEKKNHPKLYLWAKSWDEQSFGLEDNKLSLNGFIHSNILQKNEIDPKEMQHFGELTIDELKLEDEAMDIAESSLTLPTNQPQILSKLESSLDIENSALTTEQVLEAPKNKDDAKKLETEQNVPPTTLLSNLLASPGGTPVDLPISLSNTELESFAAAVQAPHPQFITSVSAPQPEFITSVSAPQPEAAIDSSECRLKLLQHIEHTHRLLDARLDMLDNYITELESEDPSFKGSEAADICPKSKQTIQMILRDLSTIEELAMIY